MQGQNVAEGMLKLVHLKITQSRLFAHEYLERLVVQGLD